MLTDQICLRDGVHLQGTMLLPAQTRRVLARGATRACFGARQSLRSSTTVTNVRLQLSPRVSERVRRVRMSRATHLIRPVYACLVLWPGQLVSFPGCECSIAHPQLSRASHHHDPHISRGYHRVPSVLGSLVVVIIYLPASSGLLVAGDGHHRSGHGHHWRRHTPHQVRTVHDRLEGSGTGPCEMRGVPQ